MGKPYNNNAVIGNGSMLGCITESGELIRLYWPEIDFPQHLEKMLTGFFDTNNPTAQYGLVRANTRLAKTISILQISW